MTGFYQKCPFIPCGCLTNSNDYINYMPSWASAAGAGGRGPPGFSYIVQI